MAATVRSVITQTIRVLAATAYNLVFPASNASGQLTNDGAGTLSWAAGSGVGLINQDTTQQGTPANTDLTTLRSFSVPGATLDADGETLHVVVGGTRIGSTNTDVVRVTFGGTTVLTLSISNASVTAWRVEVDIIRTGAATQKAIAEGAVNDGSGGLAQYTTPTETLSGASALTVTGQNGAAVANSLVYELSKIHRLDAA